MALCAHQFESGIAVVDRQDAESEISRSSRNRDGENKLDRSNVRETCRQHEQLERRRRRGSAGTISANKPCRL